MTTRPTINVSISMVQTSTRKELDNKHQFERGTVSSVLLGPEDDRTMKRKKHLFDNCQGGGRLMGCSEWVCEGNEGRGARKHGNQ